MHQSSVPFSLGHVDYTVLQLCAKECTVISSEVRICDPEYMHPPLTSLVTIYWLPPNLYYPYSSPPPPTRPPSCLLTRGPIHPTTAMTTPSCIRPCFHRPRITRKLRFDLATLPPDSMRAKSAGVLGVASKLPPLERDLFQGSRSRTQERRGREGAKGAGGGRRRGRAGC